MPKVVKPQSIPKCNMGLQVDLTKMLGLGNKVQCPNCEKIIPNMLDDFDLECGNPNPKQGIWEIDYYCGICLHEWKYKYEVKAKRLY